MKIFFINTVLFFSLWVVTFSQCTSQELLFTNKQVIQENLSNIENGDPVTMASFRKLVSDADKLVLEKEVSIITNKKILAPSGDPRDYLSRGTYWWPDNSKKGGLPYIRKDGTVNPEVYKIRDQSNLIKLRDNLRLLTLAYVYTNNKKYLNKAYTQVKVWFLNEKTRMNPHLKYAQGIPGISDGRVEGLIDSRYMVDIVDPLNILINSGIMSKSETIAVKKWFSDYLNWMTTGSIGKRASRLQNNIGTAYYLQVVSYSIFIGRNDYAKSIVKGPVLGLIDHQFSSEGMQVHELKRTNGWSYSIANFNYWLKLNTLSNSLGIDLWNYETPEGKTLRRGYEWLRPYGLGEKKWDHQQIKNIDFRSSFQGINERVNRNLAFGTTKRTSDGKSANNSGKSIAKGEVNVISLFLEGIHVRMGESEQ